MVEIVTVKIDGMIDRSTTPIETIYSTIGRQTESHILNRYLRTICSYEMETLNTIKDNDNEKVWSNFIIRDHLLASGARRKDKIINITIDYIHNVLNDLRSILEMDNDFLTRIDIYVNLRAHILSSDGIYMGHLYTWESDIPNEDSILYVDAIRSSISNILDRSRGEGLKGIILRLIDSSIKMARLVGSDIVKVRDPYPVTEHVLASMNFTKTSFPVERDIPNKMEKYRLIISPE